MMIIWKFNGKVKSNNYNLRSYREHKIKRRTVSEYNIKYTGITFKLLKDVYECQISQNVEIIAKLKKIKKLKQKKKKKVDRRKRGLLQFLSEKQNK